MSISTFHQATKSTQAYWPAWNPSWAPPPFTSTWVPTSTRLHRPDSRCTHDWASVKSCIKTGTATLASKPTFSPPNSSNLGWLTASREVATKSHPEKRKSYDTTDSGRSEEHTSELQSRPHLVCRLLLEK